MPVNGYRAAKQREQRAAYARAICEKYPSSQELLEFYALIAEFQCRISKENLVLHSRAPTQLRAAINVEKSHSYLPSLISMLKENGNTTLRKAVQELLQQPAETTLKAFKNYVLGIENDGSIGWFCARVCTQPFAELEAEQREILRGFGGSECPVCGGRPQLAVLRPEGDGGKRFLMCSFCLTEWEFRRVLCPVCEETDHQKLPRYTAEGVASTRVEACDTCKFYLKSIDMTLDGNANPLVDEIATATLDLWAEEQGFRKVHPNILGI